MSVKDWWGSRSYWLKGGILGMLFVPSILIFFIIVTEICFAEVCYSKLNPMLILLYHINYKIVPSLDIFYYIFAPASDATGLFPGQFHIFTIWPSFFLIGAIIGWIYGKIKSKENKIPVQNKSLRT